MSKLDRSTSPRSEPSVAPNTEGAAKPRSRSSRWWMLALASLALAALVVLGVALVQASNDRSEAEAALLETQQDLDGLETQLATSQQRVSEAEGELSTVQAQLVSSEGELADASAQRDGLLDDLEAATEQLKDATEVRAGVVDFGEEGIAHAWRLAAFIEFPIELQGLDGFGAIDDTFRIEVVIRPVGAVGEQHVLEAHYQSVVINLGVDGRAV